MLHNYPTIILYSPKQIKKQMKKRKRWSNEKLDVKEQMKNKDVSRLVKSLS